MEPAAVLVPGCASRVQSDKRAKLGRTSVIETFCSHQQNMYS